MALNGKHPLQTNADLRAATVWVFDLDNTLYHHSANLFAAIDLRMKRFIADFLGLSEDAAFKIQKQYFREFGTSLRGLMTLHGLDPKRFLDYVHNIDLSAIAPDPRLDSALDRLPGRKIVFTNADRPHAERVMDRLGVARRFDAVFDIFQADFTPKPDPAVYDRLVADLAIDSARCVMVEDMAKNLTPAHALGMTTVWVDTGSDFGRHGHNPGHVHYTTDNLSEWLAGVAGR